MKSFISLNNKEIALIIIVVLFVFLYLFFVVIPGTHYWTTRIEKDFIAYYQAGQEVWQHGTQGQLYELGHPLSTSTDYDGIHDLMNYIYPPLLAVIISPLTLLSVEVAAAITKVVNIILLVLSVVVLTKISFPNFLVKKNLPVLIPLLALICFFVLWSQPGLSALAHSQVSIFLLFLFSLFAYFYARRKKFLPGLLIGLASAIKIFPIIFIFYFIAKKDWKTCGWTLLWTALFSIFPIPFVGWHSYTFFFQKILPLLNTPPSSPYSHGIPSALARFFGPSKFYQPIVDSPWLIKYGALLVAVILFVLLIIWIRKSPNVLLNTSLVIVVLLLILPVNWLHYLVLLLIPFLFIIFQITNHTRNHLKNLPWFIIILSATAIGLVCLIPPLDFPKFSLITSLYGVAALFLTLGLLNYFRRQSQ